MSAIPIHQPQVITLYSRQFHAVLFLFRKSAKTLQFHFISIKRQVQVLCSLENSSFRFVKWICNMCLSFVTYEQYSEGENLPCIFTRFHKNVHGVRCNNFEGFTGPYLENLFGLKRIAHFNNFEKKLCLFQKNILWFRIMLHL